MRKRPVKLGLFVPRITQPVGNEQNVSAHAQLPLYTLSLLRDAGLETHLLTTEFPDEHTLPQCMPSGIPVHPVARYGALRDLSPSEVLRLPALLLRQALQIKHIATREECDILHFYGTFRIIYLIGLLRFWGLKTPIVLTCNHPLSQSFGLLNRTLWGNLSAVITSTEFVAQQCRPHGVAVDVVKHGIVRNLNEELRNTAVREPHRVLFWRGPSHANGIDLCLEVYRELAPRFPGISFDIAIRPNHADAQFFAPRIKQVAKEHANIHVHEFPYTEGISIGQLLSESLCVVLPFRKLSYHPQFVVLESLLFGKTVVTTALDSNVEVTNGGQDAVLVPVNNVAVTTQAIAKLLLDREGTIAFGKRAAQNVRLSWNWNTYVEDMLKIYKRVFPDLNQKVYE